jgi:aminocarboxymuconate-semialdehyde decarboxylase
MMGSDYCFDMGYERPVKAVTALKLSRSDQEKILSGNAARMLRLEKRSNFTLQAGR